MLSKQEMFDRAVRGLRSQGWKVSMAKVGSACLYQCDDGRRCAWGWVDTDLTDAHNECGTVIGLSNNGIGVAGTLDPDHLNFALMLQRAHDNSSDESLEKRFLLFSEENGLTFPEV